MMTTSELVKLCEQIVGRPYSKSNYYVEVCEFWRDAAAKLVERLQAAEKLAEACQSIDNHLLTTFPPYSEGQSPYDKVRAALAAWNAKK